MKKIVAIVLAMVMVLGLATTAMAATSTTDGLYAKLTTEDGMNADGMPVYVKYFKAVDNKVTDKGAWKADGYVAYYQLGDEDGDAAATYVKVNTIGEADVVLYTDEECEKVYMYLDAADPVYFADAVVTTNFGKACGQYTDSEDAGYDEELSYYVAFNTLYVGVEPGANYDEQVMVNGKLVPVVAANGITKNAHKPVYSFDKDNVLESVKCSVCGVVAAKAANYAALPENPSIAYEDAATGAYWYWTTGTVADAETDKVESAQTFDAGIAMYVGMSVMAAAGSAVVLKKKD